MWFLRPGLACLLPSLPGAQPSQGYSTLQIRSFFQPWAVGVVHKWGCPFPHFLYPFLGAFQPFATLIPPLLDRGWGQHKPDFSYLPALVFPPSEEGTVAGC